MDATPRNALRKSAGSSLGEAELPLDLVRRNAGTNTLRKNSNNRNRNRWHSSTNALRKNSSNNRWRSSTNALRKNSSNNRNRWRSSSIGRASPGLGGNLVRPPAGTSNTLRKNSNNRNRWRSASNALSNRARSGNALRRSSPNNRQVTRRSKETICQDDRKMYHIPCDRVWDLPCTATMTVDELVPHELRSAGIQFPPSGARAELVRLADDATLCAYLRQRAIDDACVPDDAGHRGAVDKVTRLEQCLRRRAKNRR